MGNCKDCKFWDKWDHTCNAIEWVEIDATIPDDSAAYYAEASDDSGLSAGVKTGAMFGCIKFTAKIVKT